MFDMMYFSSSTFRLIVSPCQISLTVMIFLVRVPVLSEQMLLAPPMISHDASLFTKFMSFSIF